MDRRTFVTASAAISALALCPRAQADEPSLDTLLAQLDSDPSLVENAWLYRENQVQRGVPDPNRMSTRKISQRAIDTIIKLEVSSPERYTAHYTHPIWPKGQSGVTIGIGYDLRFANEEILRRDWGEHLPEAMIVALIPVLSKGGEEAHQLVSTVQDVTVPYDVARAQFEAFLPSAVFDTESVFHHGDRLSDDSFGALVSLVFNRGTSMRGNRRREMRNIRDLLNHAPDDPEHPFPQYVAAIPPEFDNMEKLWPNPDQYGLILRRRIEKKLFEDGMA